MVSVKDNRFKWILSLDRQNLISNFGVWEQLVFCKFMKALISFNKLLKPGDWLKCLMRRSVNHLYFNCDAICLRLLLD